MLGFALFVSIVVIGGFFYLVFSGLGKMNNDEITTPLEHGSIIAETPVLNDLPKKPAKNSHWYKHTFERPRKKGK